MYLIIDFSKNFDLYSNKILEIDYKNISNEKNGEIWKNQNFNADLPMKEVLSFIIIDKQNKSPIGYNICSQKKDTIHIHRFCIDKEYQNKGYGKKLLNNLINNVKKYNFLKISLNVHKNNTQAIIFYLKNNFIIENIDKNNIYMINYCLND